MGCVMTMTPLAHASQLANCKVLLVTASTLQWQAYRLMTGGNPLPAICCITRAFKVVFLSQLFRIRHFENITFVSSNCHKCTDMDTAIPNFSCNLHAVTDPLSLYHNYDSTTTRLRYDRTTIPRRIRLRRKLSKLRFDCDTTTIRLYDVSLAPASIRRDSTRAKNEHVNFSS